MFDKKKKHGKIKNEKIQQWRMELANYSYDIVYRSGKQNLAPDTLSRAHCSLMTTSDANTLKKLHDNLCHPGITRMTHFVKSSNLPYSVEDIRKICSSCSACAKLKPKFHKFEGTLIKATQPLERLNVDFKGSLPTTSQNRYLLVIIDE